jgi:hypothetical protein
LGISIEKWWVRLFKNLHTLDEMQIKNCTRFFWSNYIRNFHHLMKVSGFFLSKCFYCNTWRQSEFARVTYDYVILCFAIPAFYFLNFLGLGFCFYKVMIYFFIFFGLGSKLETNQASQSPAPPCRLDLARTNKKWTKVMLKWKCKIGIYIVPYCAKWLLIKHLKEVHGLVAEKA